MPPTASDIVPIRTAGGADASAVAMARRCEASGEELPAGSPIVAVLSEPAEGETGAGPMGLVRRAVSAAAWEGGFRPAGMVCFWRTSLRAAASKPRLDDALLLELLDRYAESPEDPPSPRRESLHFILALVLLRRRHLRLAGRSRDLGGEWWHFERRGGDGEGWKLSLRAVSLDESEIAEAAASLGELLGDPPRDGEGGDAAEAAVDGDAAKS
jgi:hypothetical protein